MDYMKLKYSDLQILKHSLQYYINRPDADNEDLEQEKHLLNKIVERVEEMKERYRI